MVYNFESKRFGMKMKADFEIDYTESGRSMVVMSLLDYRGAISQAHTILEAVDLLDEVLDVMLTMDLEEDLKPLGYEFDQDSESFFYQPQTRIR